MCLYIEKRRTLSEDLLKQMRKFCPSLVKKKNATPSLNAIFAKMRELSHFTMKQDDTKVRTHVNTCVSFVTFQQKEAAP